MKRKPHLSPSVPEGAVPEDLAASADFAGGNAEKPLHSPGKAKVKTGYLVAMIFASFALYVAWIAPVGFSLAIRVEQLDAANKGTLLAISVGISGILAIVMGPIAGILSDRTRLRLGKRRTWMLVGMLAGFVGSILVGLSPNIAMMIAAWALAYMGYTVTGGMFLTHMGDILPEEQRGKVAGFSGAMSQVAPILGIMLAGRFVGTPALLFGIPAAFALVIGTIFLFIMKDSPAPKETGPVDFQAILKGFWFNPREHPNFAWVWISRTFIFLALSFMQVYSVYLLGQRLELESSSIAGIVSTAGLMGIVAAVLGSIASGSLSDKLHTRKPFIVLGGVLVAAGLLTIGTVQSIPQYFIGNLIAVLGVGVFGAVDQAIGLDNLPEGDEENGRFMGIFNLANQIAQAVGPFLAAAILAGFGGRYAGVYYIAAVVAVIGGLLILPVKQKKSAAATSTAAAE